jgi:hypothetical protein
MIGKTMRLLACTLVLLLGLALMSVPYAETSSRVIVPAYETLPPPTLPVRNAPIFSPAPVDISELTEPPVRLTQGGCCPYAGWSHDSEWILYLDGKLEEASTGLYSLPRSGGPPGRLSERFGIFSTDWSLVAYQEAGQVFVERWADAARWSVPSNGRAVSFSPDMTQLAWEYGATGIQSPDRRQAQVWTSNLRGEGARELVTIHGGELVGWVGGSEAILVTGRLSPPGPAGIWRIDTVTGIYWYRLRGIGLLL